jgi:DNA-binding transcriptional MocR family regulator
LTEYGLAWYPYATLHRPEYPLLDRTDALGLSEQIAAFYRDAIRAGRLQPGDRLPPIRAVAEGVGVTRATVQEAYRRLSDGGLVEGTVGRGTSVLANPSGPGTASPLSAFAEAALRQTQEMPGAPPLPEGRPLVANLAELSPDGGLYPVTELRAAMDRVLQQRGAELLGYGHSATGLPELRALLCERSRAADPTATVDDILITAGAQQGLDLVLRTFCTAGDAVVVTAPSYHQMFGLLKAHGLQAVPVTFGQEGIDVDELAQALAKPHVRLLYLMPSFHNPTGRSLDRAQRQALIDTVAKTQVPILEDEYQEMLRFRGEAPPALRTLDPRGLTVTVRTFSKGLFPGLRMGWVHGGPAVLRPMAAMKRFMDLETSPLLQAALVEFVQQGAMDRYLQRLCGELQRRHGALQQGLRGRLPAGCTITDPDGGFVAWLELPEPGQGDRLADLAAEHGIRIVPGRVFEANGRPSRGARLSLSRASQAQIEAGAAILVELAHDLVRAPLAAPARHFL